jgi:hypothetical protein
VKKGLIVGLMCVLSAGCSQGPDFSKPSVIDYKEQSKYEPGIALYGIDGSDGVRGEGLGSIRFKAHSDFAEIGDSIVFKNGVLAAVKPK